MNNRGFTLIELLGCLTLIAIVFGIGFGMTRGTWSSTLPMIDNVSENEIYNTAKVYVLENDVNWVVSGDNVYTCVMVNDMVSDGYFEETEVSNYQNQFVKVIKNNETKVITDFVILKECN